MLIITTPIATNMYSDKLLKNVAMLIPINPNSAMPSINIRIGAKKLTLKPKVRNINSSAYTIPFVIKARVLDVIYIAVPVGVIRYALILPSAFS